MNASIRNRLLGTTTVVLVLFLALVGWVLDSAYRVSVLAGAEEQLKQIIYALMGAVEEDAGRLYIEAGLSEPRLSQPDSGLYARLSDDLNGQLWLSASAATSDVPFSMVQGEPGAFVFESNTPLLMLSYTVIWEGATSERVTFSAAMDEAPFKASINRFRGSLGGGFLLATVVFVIAQLLALRWGLRPLVIMADEVEALEQGERETLSDAYPRELEGLAQNLGRFVEHEKRSRSRYRHALEDLAHSLKTPLAVVRNALLETTPDRGLLGEQLDRMETTVTHQLSKASARGPVVVGKAVDVGEQNERLLRALSIAYADKGVATDSHIEPSLVKGDESDFLEIFGNLIENAYKYTEDRVEVTVVSDGGDVHVCVDDNGPGIPADRREEALARGQRLDQIEPGQGIGMAVVADLVDLYGGRLDIVDSPLGGARLMVQLPGAAP